MFGRPLARIHGVEDSFAQRVTLGFEGGVPVSVDGKALGPVALVEALNDLGTQAACFGALAALVASKGRTLGGVLWAVGLLIALFAKGPASVAPIVSVAVVGLAMAPGRRLARAGALLPGFVIASGLFAWWTLHVRAAIADHPEPALQNPGGFLWS